MSLTTPEQPSPVTSLPAEQLYPSAPFGRIRLKHTLGELDLVVAVLAGLFVVLWLPVFITNTVPRNAVAYGLAPLGLWLVAMSARRGDRASIAALVCCALFVLSGVLAVAPRTAFVGQMPEWASVLALVASLAWWGLGRSLSLSGRRFLLYSLTAGAVVNGVVGVVQLLARFNRPSLLFPIPGRASGLMSNPVFYGSVMVGVAALWIAHTSAHRARGGVALCALLTFLASLSGSRVVLLSLLVVWVVSCILYRRGALVPAAASAAGFLAAELFSEVVTDSRSSVSRLQSGESVGERLDIWRLSVEAFWDRPLLGWGPANAELAIMRQIDLPFVEKHSADGNVVIWWDPHNTPVFLLLSVGLVGTVAVLVFLALSLRGTVSAPILIGVGAIAATWMLQPFSVHSLPVAMLLLGAAVRPKPNLGAAVEDGALSKPSRGLDRPQAALLAVGALVTMAMLTTAFVVDRSVKSGDVDRAADAARFLGPDPWLKVYMSDAYLTELASGNADVALLVAARAHATEAAELFPTADHYQRVADVAIYLDDLDGAESALETAVALEPWDPFANARLYRVADHLGDDATATEVRAKLCAMGSYWCSWTNPPTTSEGNG